MNKGHNNCVVNWDGIKDDGRDLHIVRLYISAHHK